MSYFRSLRESLGSYISLSPNAPESRAVTSTVPLDPDLHLGPKTPSPTRRTREWIKSNNPEKSTKKSNVLGVKGSRIAKSSSTQRPTAGSGSSTTSRGKILGLLSSLLYNKSSNEVEDELDGSTFIEDVPTDRSLGTVDDTTLIEYNYGRGQARFATPSDEVQTEDYTEDEMWLHQKLVHRGEEPLFHNAWGLDFPTFPEDLFTLDKSEIFIHSISNNDFHACKALEGLLFLPSRVRDRVARKLPPDGTIRREVEAYYKWSMDDAALTNIEHFPVLIIAAGAPNEPTPALIARATDRLHQIGRQYRHFWIDTTRSNDMEQQYTHDLPILYGIVIKFTVVTFVTYDVAMPQRPLRFLAQFNFAQRGQDVWNCLAAAILIVRARNYLRKLQAEGQLGKEITKEVIDEDL